MVYIKMLTLNMILMVFDIDGKHRDTNTKYDSNGFDINSKHKDANTKYDSNGFDRHGLHKRY